MKAKAGWHPRNRHQGRYDIDQLARSSPGLAPFVKTSPRDELTIDFSDPQAVRALNRALLSHFYGLSYWEIPPDYLCPPVPGRSDYVHHAADLLASSDGGIIPRGGSTRVLDIGVGANCIYPLVGHCEYGWHFVGTDTDSLALDSAERIVKSNPKLSGAIQFRKQASSKKILRGILSPEDIFALSICNPPFHASLEEAREGNLRKRQNLGIKTSAAKLNFGGHGAELWCPGGEADFVGRMIEESAEFRKQVSWFTTLISKEATLAGVYRALDEVEATDVKTLELAHGQKKSRVVAWTFGERVRARSADWPRGMNQKA